MGASCWGSGDWRQNIAELFGLEQSDEYGQMSSLGRMEDSCPALG